MDAPHRMDRRIHSLFVLFALASCVEMPEPPPEAEDLSALAARYDKPTADLAFERVQQIIEEARRRNQFSELLRRLQFIRTAISDTSTGLGVRTSNRIELQGRLSATLPCPGDAPVRTTDGKVNGLLRMELGVADSRLRRGFQGWAEQCRWFVETPDMPAQRVVLSARLVGDLGGDIGVGNTLPTDILLRLADVTGSATSTAGTVSIPFGEYHFRLTREEGFGTLIEPSTYGFPDVGSVVLVVRRDGSFGVRERRGEWVCGGGGQGCLLK
jgi:hypothetical protein